METGAARVRQGITLRCLRRIKKRRKLISKKFELRHGNQRLEMLGQAIGAKQNQASDIPLICAQFRKGLDEATAHLIPHHRIKSTPTMHSVKNGVACGSETIG